MATTAEFLPADLKALERALVDNGWTSDDVRFLTLPGVLERVRTFVHDDTECLLTKGEPAQVKIEHAFSKELCCERLHCEKPLYTRVSNALRGNSEWLRKNPQSGHNYTLDTLGDLIEEGRDGLTRLPYIGRSGIHLIERVLNHYGLELPQNRSRTF